MTGHSLWLPRIVAWHARLSLTRKLTSLGVPTSIVSLVIGLTAVLAWDLSSARTRLVGDAGMLADVIGSNSTAAVAVALVLFARRVSLGHVEGATFGLSLILASCMQRTVEARTAELSAVNADLIVRLFAEECPTLLQDIGIALDRGAPTERITFDRELAETLCEP